MQKVWIIDVLRHGETTLSHTLRGHLDDALTPTGWQQMQTTIEQMQPSAWQVIFTSPLQRCAAFAQRFASQTNLNCNMDANFKEMYFGDWEGISTAQIYQQSPELLTNFWQQPTQYTAPNGESLLDFQSRIQQGLFLVIEKMQIQQHEHALLVTHGGVIKLLRCMAQHQPLDDLLKMQATLGQLYRFKITLDDQQQLQISEE
ncbi:histidine phosphatase family protein [Acinetobacter ursingii]|uniref:histidine phosphatase family protein n=1 Tax=Acinetobacter ursingii TaxID=108980 RepID=UPI003AF8189E